MCASHASKCRAAHDSKFVGLAKCIHPGITTPDLRSSHWPGLFCLLNNTVILYTLWPRRNVGPVKSQPDLAGHLKAGHEWGIFSWASGCCPMGLPLRAGVCLLVKSPPFPSLQPLGPDARPSQISGARACRASVALHHHLMGSCHSFALLATTSPRCSGTPLWRRKGSRARTPSRFIWSTSILCNTASTVASHGAKYQPRRVNLRGTMRILAHCIDK